VLAASADGHLYAFNREGGNQEWRRLGKVDQPLLEHDGVLYYVDTGLDSGIAQALAFRLSDEVELWSVNLSAASMAPNAQPETGFIAAEHRLFIGVSSNGTYYVVRMERVGGGAVVAFAAGGSPIRGLAIGHQLLYVAGGGLWALDLDTLEVIWSKPNDFGIPATLPVYAAQGVSSVAELYIGVTDGRTYALDANTGAILHIYPSNEEEVRGVAFGDTALYIVSRTRIRGFERRSTGLYWDTAISEMRGAPIVSADQLILMGANGTIWFVHPGTGALQQGPTVNAPVAFAPAASGSYLFIPADDGQVYGFTQ
jgi:outer membrane protein assembly factor BamB